jgi:hypothetical protein
MVKGRSILRLAQRVASVVSCRPARCKAPTARFLRGHGSWPGAGANGGVVFAVEGVAEPVQGPDRPLAADQGGDGLRAGAGGVQAGDAEGGDVGQRCAVQGGDVPLDQVCLADVRERQVAGRVHDLDGTGFDPAVAAVGGGVGDRDAAPGQGVRGIEQAGLIVFDRQDEVRAGGAGGEDGGCG